MGANLVRLLCTSARSHHDATSASRGILNLRRHKARRAHHRIQARSTRAAPSVAPLPPPPPPPPPPPARSPPRRLRELRQSASSMRSESLPPPSPRSPKARAFVRIETGGRGFVPETYRFFGINLWYGAHLGCLCEAAIARGSARVRRAARARCAQRARHGVEPGPDTGHTVQCPRCSRHRRS